MNASSHIVEIDESNAQQLLIEESMTRPVVVDFWADWCGPCKQLMPVLEKLADEYQGAFLLAKVNADEQQMLAQQLGVRSLPTVMVIKEGQSQKHTHSVTGRGGPTPPDREGCFENPSGFTIKVQKQAQK